MLGFLGTKIGAYIIVAVMLIAVIGGFVLHLRAEANTIVQLNQQVTLLSVQTKNLQVANDAMRVDVANVQDAQRAANSAIDTVRAQAITQSQAIQHRTFITGTPTAIQIQINKEMGDRFKKLEDITRAP